MYKKVEYSEKILADAVYKRKIKHYRPLLCAFKKT